MSYFTVKLICHVAFEYVDFYFSEISVALQGVKEVEVKFLDFSLTFPDQTGLFSGGNSGLLQYQNYQAQIFFEKAQLCSE